MARHYDVLSPHYRRLWGPHLHHGYFERGDETRQQAAERLLELLVELCDVEPGARVLDVGCGFGGTCRWLAERLGVTVVGVTLSPVQARMARDESAESTPKPRYVVGDGSCLPLGGRFDLVLAIEVLSHLDDRGAFFAAASSLLRSEADRAPESGEAQPSAGPSEPSAIRPGAARRSSSAPRAGRIGIGAWLRAADLGADGERRFIEPIERGMLVSLPTLEEYRGHFRAHGFVETHASDISDRVAPTWDRCLELLREPALWSLAASQGPDIVEFLRAFRAMRRGLASGAFRYALLVAERR